MRSQILKAGEAHPLSHEELEVPDETPFELLYRALSFKQFLKRFGTRRGNSELSTLT